MVLRYLRERTIAGPKSQRNLRESVYNQYELELSCHTLDLDDTFLEFQNVIRESAAKVNSNTYVPAKAKTVVAKAVLQQI